MSRSQASLCHENRIHKDKENRMANERCVKVPENKITHNNTGERPYHTDNLDCDFEDFQESDSHTISMPSMSGETTNLRKKSALVDYSSDATTENYDTLESDLELVGYSSSSDDFSMDLNSLDSENLIERELK